MLDLLLVAHFAFDDMVGSDQRGRDEPSQRIKHVQIHAELLRDLVHFLGRRCVPTSFEQRDERDRVEPVARGLGVGDVVSRPGGGERDGVVCSTAEEVLRKVGLTLESDRNVSAHRRKECEL